jgi:glycine betaine catabolism B
MTTAKIESIHRVTPDVKQFLLSVDGEIDYEPGQHTTIRFEQDDEEVVRPYTATSLPGTDRFTLAIRRYDDGTASVYMHEREVGDEVEIGEFGGNLTLDDPTANVAFVATGTGITPMAALIKQHVETVEGEARLFFGESTEEDVIYRETFDQLAAQNARFEPFYSLSEPGEGWTGPTGHVQEHLPEEVEEITDWQFYVCGVPEMVVETKELLSEEGVPEEQVFSEGWEDGEVEE